MKIPKKPAPSEVIKKLKKEIQRLEDEKKLIPFTPYTTYNPYAFRG